MIIKWKYQSSIRKAGAQEDEHACMYVHVSISGFVTGIRLYVMVEAGEVRILSACLLLEFVVQEQLGREDAVRWEE